MGIQGRPGRPTQGVPDRIDLCLWEACLYTAFTQVGDDVSHVCM